VLAQRRVPLANVAYLGRVLVATRDVAGWRRLPPWRVGRAGERPRRLAGRAEGHILGRFRNHDLGLEEGRSQELDRFGT